MFKIPVGNYSYFKISSSPDEIFFNQNSTFHFHSTNLNKGDVKFSMHRLD